MRLRCPPVAAALVLLAHQMAKAVRHCIYKMRAFVTVHTQEDYDKWLADRAAQAQSDAQPSAVASR